MKTKTLLTLITTILIISCAPSKTSTPTETAMVINDTIPLTSVTRSSRPTNTTTPTITPTPMPLLLPTATATPRPSILSYSTYTDGGDDFDRCMLVSDQPSFILYQDGVLIRFRKMYLQSKLSQAEIASLLNKITATGLLEHAQKEYSDGFGVLTIGDKSFFGPIGSIPPSTSDPLSKAILIVNNYEPKKESRYMPENLTLEIFATVELDEVIERLLPKPTPVFRDWRNSPLSEYGEGWNFITGKDLPKVMSQFSKFPDLQVFQDSTTKLYYVAAICANYPYR